MYKRHFLNVLMNKITVMNELHTVTNFYGSDFDPAQLGIQLQLLKAHLEEQGKIRHCRVPSITSDQWHSAVCILRLLDY